MNRFKIFQDYVTAENKKVLIPMALFALLIVSSVVLLVLAIILLFVPYSGAILSADIVDSIAITIMLTCMLANERVSKKIDMLDDNPSEQIKMLRHMQFRFSQLVLGFVGANWVLTMIFHVTWLSVAVAASFTVMWNCMLVMLAKWKREAK